VQYLTPPPAPPKAPGEAGKAPGEGSKAAPHK
jgi:hypothetical protein